MTRSVQRRSGLTAIALALATTFVTAGVLADPPMATLNAPRPPEPVKAVAASAPPSSVAPNAAKPTLARPAERAGGKPPPPEKQWIKTSSGDGIVTFKREVPGSPIIALLGAGTVNAPIIRVASVLLDYTRATEWIDSLEEVRVVRMLGPLEFIEYDHVGSEAREVPAMAATS